MRRIKNTAPKSTPTKKQKLTKEERSQIAKDRWVKRRAATKAQEVTAKSDPVKEWVDEAVRDGLLTPAPPVVEQVPSVQTGRDENGVPPIVGLGDGTITKNGQFVPDQPPSIPAAPTVEAPAPQLAPVRAPKPKRYQGPKEFSVALKAAESRLAKAILERAQAAGQLAMLQAEIPSLLQIIQALKGSNNLPPAPYDLSGGVPNAVAYQAPLQQFDIPANPLAAVQAAMEAAQVSLRASKAVGGVQLTPDVVGSLEDEGDDIDKFITGPSDITGKQGWIGG